METIQTIDYKGYEIRILTDPECDSDWINDGDAFVVYDHRDFYIKRKGFNPDNIFEHIYETKRFFYENHYVFPLFAYIHSGVSLSLSRGTDRRDTSYKGFVLVKREKGWTYTREKAFKIAQSTVKTWNEYLGGEVYSFLTDFDGCSGYFGDEGIKDAIEEAKSSIDYHIKQEMLKHFKTLKTWIKNRVPYQYRNQLILQ